MNPATNLILVGPMGAGKSSIGKRLAERFGLRFVDVDQAIVERTGATIPVLFEHVGEAGFRQRERELLAEILQGEGQLVSTGGGAVIDPDNRRLIRGRGFVFYTHLDGRKGRELQANPHAALLFHWPRVREGVQVRIEGDVEIVADAEADAYFASRPRGSQVGAWASEQSTTLDSRDTFEQRIARFEREFEGREVPRPPRWTGFRVVPHAVEFWYGAQFRLHERWLHERDAGGLWQQRMLYP